MKIEKSWESMHTIREAIRGEKVRITLKFASCFNFLTIKQGKN